MADVAGKKMPISLCLLFMGLLAWPNFISLIYSNNSEVANCMGKQQFVFEFVD